MRAGNDLQMPPTRLESVRPSVAGLPAPPAELLGPYLVTDMHGRVLHTNAAAGTLLGRTRADAGGTELAELVSPADRPALERALRSLGREPGRRELAVHIVSPGGAPRGALLVGAPLLPPEDGIAWLVYATGGAPSGPEPGESAVDRAQLETIVEWIPAGIILIEVPGGKVGIVNQQARAILGFDRPNDRLGAGGEPYAMYDVEGRRLERQELPVERAARGETVSGERVWIMGAGGARVALDMHAAPVRAPDGRITAAVTVFQDVTEQEERRRAASDFITNAAHELRTPIAAIASAVEVLESGAKFRASDRDHFLGHIGRETARLVRLTHALLVLARAQSGVEAARLEIVEVEPVLREVASGLRPAAGVRLLVRVAPGVAVLANRGLLEQALSALASNASRYTTNGRISLTTSKRGGRLLVNVRDTGPGMTDEQLAVAGRRFAQGGGPDAGFGLGLSIARQAVEAMGGVLTLESEPGVGTTGTIALPAARLVMP